jgi:hypothetical protein
MRHANASKNSRSERPRPPASPGPLGLLLIGLIVLSCGGCAGYRLGPSNGQTAGEKTIQVGPFANHTLEPRLGDALTAALRKGLQRDGTYRLVTRDEGDVIVTGAIMRYERNELSYNPSDVLTVLDYRATMTAHVTARERDSGKTLLDRDVTGYTLVHAGSDLATAERQALPLLAEDLAKNISGLLVDGTW